MANYTYLVNDILETTENGSDEFLSSVPKMVNKAELRLTKDLDDYGLVSYTSVAVSSGKNIISLPQGTRILKNFNIVSNGTKINLLQRTDEFINDYWPVSASTGTPEYYARRDNTTVIVAPTPVSTVSGQVVHISRPVTLASATPNNYFSDFCYDALYNASMVEALLYMKNYEPMSIYETRYKEALAALLNQSRRTRRDDMQAPASPAGGDNTVIQGSL
jgi:hypothetical protein|tara:strand:+ start:1046 stop:1702 length:657 start_codon:yes stop_codon:yes gene_type:complete